MGKSDDDDFGFRTPTRKHKKVTDEDSPKTRDTGKRKRETGKHKRADEKKRETGKRKRETGKHKRETGKHKRADEKKRETGKHKRADEKKRETGKHKRATGKHKVAEVAPKPPGPKGNPLPMIAGLGAALILGGVIAALMTSGTEAPQGPIAKRPQRDTFTIKKEPQTARPIQSQPSIAAPEPVAEPLTDELVELPTESVLSETPKASALEELAKKSSTHAALARLLDEYKALFDPKAMHNPGPLLDSFRERQQREQELLERLRAMGAGAVAALEDMLLGLDNRQFRIFLGKGLAGIEGRDALEAVTKVLGEVKDVALQTTLVRFLPPNPDSTHTIGAAIGQEENGNLRCMLLREYHRRLGTDDETGRDVFREAALNDADQNVRAEAVTIIGRRGDARDQGLMEQIIGNEENLSIRQRAIVSYAETGKENSLPFLEGLVRQPDTALPVRASAVLAIGRVGGPQAILTLDTIAQTDASQEIRTRATRLVQSLRRRQQDEANGGPAKARPIRTPMRTGAEAGRPGGGSPIQRR